MAEIKTCSKDECLFNTHLVMTISIRHLRMGYFSQETTPATPHGYYQFPDQNSQKWIRLCPWLKLITKNNRHQTQSLHQVKHHKDLIFFCHIHSPCFHYLLFLKIILSPFTGSYPSCFLPHLSTQRICMTEMGLCKCMCACIHVAMLTAWIIWIKYY